MGVSAIRAPDGHGATVVTSQKVREGHEDDYQRWQERTNRAVRAFDGFEGTEMYPPGVGDERAWVVVFRFGRIDQLTTWLESGERRRLLAEGRPLFEGAPSQEVLAGDEAAATEEAAVTAVISHHVLPGHEEDFARWQDKVLKAQGKFPGFMGTELFKPVAGIQDNWVVIFRFDTRRHLDQWLGSDVRAKLLAEGENYFSAYDVHKVGSAFSGWFRFGEDAEGGAPPNWKQAMSVLLALYPTVMVLNLTVGDALEDAGVRGYLSLFIGNLLSVSALTWLLMPLVNRGLAFWLVPSRALSVRTQVVGTVLVVLCWALCILIFGLTTG
ncbi:antibiotic biosynthesis monooxygenase [Streptomyces sp. HUCO-GS316]|uniref:antibiotic biosynthesis monooxygenase n=1 Tax=Streptomyces sp. HUCO-GS316 TaxID=2692198 RepID=UPI0013721154|nr:antibiotic biosynthesis monooxygenase [Streptomyces sp. HUCO-GS316]MXM62555.1 antibiotic biosynthesis monooxygenase [Streptomyces sp. HUCO-GS316]